MIIRAPHESSSLAAKMLGDPGERDLFVYLPGYEESDRRYATAVLLHAFGQNAESLVHPPTDRQRWQPPLEDVLDPVFGRMGVPPMIVVIPDGSSRGAAGNGPTRCQRALRFLRRERCRGIPRLQLPHDRRGPEPGGLRLLLRGHGRLEHVSQNPDVFAAMAVLSADTFLDMTHKVFTYKYFDNIWPEAPGGPVEEDDWSMMTYAYSAAYSPNPGKPPFFVDLPVAWPSGEVIQEVWDRWLSHDPVENCRDRLDNLRRLSGILLDAGVRDDYELQWGHRVLSHRLSEAGIAHKLTENPGNHGGRSKERLQVDLRSGSVRFSPTTEGHWGLSEPGRGDEPPVTATSTVWLMSADERPTSSW